MIKLAVIGAIAVIIVLTLFACLDPKPEDHDNDEENVPDNRGDDDDNDNGEAGNNDSDDDFITYDNDIFLTRKRLDKDDKRRRP